MAGNKSSTKAVIAVVVIIAAIVVIWKYGLKENPGATPKETVFICSNCGHEFKVVTEEIPKLQDKNPDRATGMIECPNCKEFASRVGVRCIHCGKYYLEQEAINKFGERVRCIHCEKSAREAPETK